MPDQDSRIGKWLRWLDPTIKSEVLGMYSHRHVYRTVAKMTQLHGALPPTHFFDYLSTWYVSTQSLAVRRQAETSSRVVSLGRLLTEIHDDPTRLTKQRYVAQADEPWMAERLERTFAETFGGAVIEHVDPDLIARDIQELADSAEHIKQYVDRHLAHTDAQPLTALPTYDILNAAIDQIGGIFRKCALLLTASSWSPLVPVVQYDWLAAFKEPWLLPEHEVAVRAEDQ